MRIHLSLLPMALVIGLATAGEPMPLKITTKRDDDRVEQKADKNSATVSIRSPSGISHAVMERTGDKWPDAVIVRLHLKGLENFRVTNGTAKIELAAGIQEGKPQVRQWKDGNEAAPLDEKSPYWIGVRILGDDGAPAKEIPLKGYFELRLPPALFEKNPKSITVHWIDFYRN